MFSVLWKDENGGKNQRDRHLSQQRGRSLLSLNFELSNRMLDGGATVDDGNRKQLNLILDNKMNVCFISFTIISVR